jgi:signal transduction histidine kinase
MAATQMGINLSWQVFQVILLTSTVLVVASVLIGFVLAETIVKPIIELRNSAKKVSSGNFNQLIKIKRKDEIGDLTDSFNEMLSQLKKSRREIANYTKNLEQKVAQRTKDLNKSLKELKEMNRKKDEFISIAAHELKTPITSIHGFSQLLQKYEEDNDRDKRRKYMSIIDNETKRLNKLVTEILDLSRIDVGSFKLNEEEVEVAKVIEDIRKEMDVQIRAKGLASDYKIGKIPVIRTDRERLIQVLINLINNSVKYTPKGKITVEAFAEKKKVHFIIRDTGIGIAKENHSKIFGRFYQVDSSYTRAAGGTGLGLSLSKEYVNAMGGNIWFKSQLGKGSEFHFTIPLK